jgi:hypothetical protein
MFTSCAGKQTDVTQITVTDVTVIQTTGNFMDAGRGERKEITHAGLTLARSNLTFIGPVLDISNAAHALSF